MKVMHEFLTVWLHNLEDSDLHMMEKFNKNEESRVLNFTSNLKNC